MIKVLKGETTIVPECRVTLNINDKLQFLNESNTTISPDTLKIKVIQGIFKQNIKPKCQIKWEEQYRGKIDWTQIWKKLKKIKVTNKVKEFQWKCLHNINYTEHRLKKMNLSNGRCHLCQIRDNDETMQHLFFKCPSVYKIIKEIEEIFNRSGLTANIEIKELNIMLGLYGGEDLDVIFNTVIFISKWEIWKIRNKVKYNQSRIGGQTIFNTWKNNFKKHLQCTLQTSHINENDKNKLELFRNNI